MSKTQISREQDKILKNRERLSYSFRNYNSLTSTMDRQFFLSKNPCKISGEAYIREGLFSEGLFSEGACVITGRLR